MNDKLSIAKRMHKIQPFYVMDLLAKARQKEAAGASIVHMEIGEPDFETPAPIVEAAVSALRSGYTHYTPALGLPALREAVAAYYQQCYGVLIAPERVVITPGASGALLLALAVLLDVGDEVLMADPGYPCNRHFVYLLEGVVKAIAVDASTAYQLDDAHVLAHVSPRTAAVMLASPANPTGTVIQDAVMQRLLAVAADHRVTVIVDEIYQGLVYAEQAQTALKFSDDVFVVNSFSKYFGMTGFRLGWLVVPQGYTEVVDRLAQNIFLAASTPAQYAALAAFLPQTRDILEQRRVLFCERRDFLLPQLQQLGFDIPVTPEGAFYIYADCSRLSDDGFHLSHDLLEKAGVAITPGVDFGEYCAKQYVRFAYTTDKQYLEQGVERIAGYLKAYGQ